MIKHTGKLLLIGLATLTLTACFGSEETRSTEWYVQNSNAQAVEITSCKAHPDLSNTPNCIAANEAEVIITQGHEAIKKYLDDHGLRSHSIGQ